MPEYGTFVSARTRARFVVLSPTVAVPSLLPLSCCVITAWRANDTTNLPATCIHIVPTPFSDRSVAGRRVSHVVVLRQYYIGLLCLFNTFNKIVVVTHSLANPGLFQKRVVFRTLHYAAAGLHRLLFSIHFPSLLNSQIALLSPPPPSYPR